MIVLAAAVGFVVARYYVTHYVPPVFQATSKIYIAGSDTSISLDDLKLGSSLAKDYQEVFKIHDVHQRVADMLGLDYSSSKLAGMVSASSPSNSHLLYVTVKSTDPEEAKQLADAYAEVVPDFIASRMEMRRPQIIEKARKPGSPISPNVKRTAKDGAVACGMSAVFLFFIIFLTDDRIRSARDITHAAELPVLGTIPVRRPEKNEKCEPPNPNPPDRDTPLAAIRGNPALDHDAIESIHTICTGIAFAGNKLRKIAITSCAPNEGKTFMALQLSVCMANRGKKTLLIDCDLRKSTMLSRYGIQLNGSDAGLAHYLSGQCGLSDVLYATSIPNLSLVPIGQHVKTPLALLSSFDFDKLLIKLCDSFDMIFIDTPPVGSFVDAVEIAKRCDGTILIVESKKARGRMLKAAVDHLRITETPILGCVLNKKAVSLWKSGAGSGKGRTGIFSRRKAS